MHSLHELFMENLTEFVRNILERAKVMPVLIEGATTPAAMAIMLRAFTPSIANTGVNYETLEQTGDAAVNHVIVRYLTHRFTQLNSPKGVDMIGRLKSKYNSGAVMASIATKNGFKDMVKTLQAKKAYDNNAFSISSSMLEDIYEAFFGALELVLDVKFGMGVSMAVNFAVVKLFFDSEDIALTDENLTDVKTRVNELFQANPVLGPLKFASELISGAADLHEYKTVIYANLQGGRVVVGTGTGGKIKDAERVAASVALSTLAKEGFVRETPKIFEATAEQSLPQIIELNNLLKEKINFL